MSVITKHDKKESGVMITGAYLNASYFIKEHWLEWMEITEDISTNLQIMITELQNQGLSRSKAIDHIVEEFKGLKGFSRANVYKQLPQQLKQTYSHQNDENITTNEGKNMQNLQHVSNETNRDNLQENTRKVVNITTSHETQEAEIITDVNDDNEQQQQEENLVDKKVEDKLSVVDIDLKKEQKFYELKIKDLTKIINEQQNDKLKLENEVNYLKQEIDSLKKTSTDTDWKTKYEKSNKAFNNQCDINDELKKTIETLKQPYEIHTDLEIKDELIPVLVKCLPAISDCKIWLDKTRMKGVNK